MPKGTRAGGTGRASIENMKPSLDYPVHPVAEKMVPITRWRSYKLSANALQRLSDFQIAIAGISESTDMEMTLWWKAIGPEWRSAVYGASLAGKPEKLCFAAACEDVAPERMPPEVFAYLVSIESGIRALEGGAK